MRGLISSHCCRRLRPTRRLCFRKTRLSLRRRTWRGSIRSRRGWPFCVLFVSALHFVRLCCPVPSVRWCLRIPTSSTRCNPKSEGLRGPWACWCHRDDPHTCHRTCQHALLLTPSHSTDYPTAVRSLPWGGGRSEHEAVATAGGRVGALLLTFDAEFMDGGLASSAANATLEPGELPSHWGQQVAYPDL